MAHTEAAPGGLNPGDAVRAAAKAAAAAPFATALRRTLSEGYTRADLRADVLSGLVVGIVALPLSMALSIAVGVPPQHGLYTAIVAGAAVALTGGCRFQVTGPTAAFIVILAPIVTKYGLSGLLTAGLLAGVMLVAMGILRMGRLIQFIPHPVTTGFTTGIATVIATLQLKDVFGLKLASNPEHFTDKLVAYWSARATAGWQDLLVAALTFALLLVVPRFTKRVPAPLIALGVVSGLVALVHWIFPGFAVATIGTRFQTTVNGVTVSGIPGAIPTPTLPWGGGLSLQQVRELLPAAFAIAMLGAIESLLSAVIADGMTGTRHDPNAELVGLGIGNILAPIFGGIAATGALARTATNIRAGARSPFASVTHALVVLLSIVVLSPLVAYVPMASLAALLLLVAWNMSEVHSFAGLVRVAPKSDVFVLITCYLLTVLLDMVVAVSVGVVLAAFLFMRRMAELTESRTLLEGEGESEAIQVPSGVGLYEIKGPLFFGAAQQAMGAIHAARGDRYAVMILDLGKVSVIDATGLAALENAIASQVRLGKYVILAGPLPKPQQIFDRAHLEQRYPRLITVGDLPTALREAARLVRESRAEIVVPAPAV